MVFIIVVFVRVVEDADPYGFGGDFYSFCEANNKFFSHTLNNKWACEKSSLLLSF